MDDRKHRPQLSHMTGERKVTGQGPGMRPRAGQPHARPLCVDTGWCWKRRGHLWAQLLDSCSHRDRPTSNGVLAGNRVISAPCNPQLHRGDP